MKEEIVDVINRQNKAVGQSKKSVVHQEGLRHRVSAALLQNKKGKYLIPTASEKKVEAGKLYHSAAGHVPSGETYLQSAKRELREETNLLASEKDFKYLGTFWLVKTYATRIEKERFEVFRVAYLRRMGKIKLNEEQLNEQWFGEKELRDLYFKSPLRISYPLRLSCRHIFKF